MRELGLTPPTALLLDVTQLGEVTDGPGNHSWGRSLTALAVVLPACRAAPYRHHHRVLQLARDVWILPDHRNGRHRCLRPVLDSWADSWAVLMTCTGASGHGCGSGRVREL